MATEPASWLPCSTCKGDLGFDELYYVCSVSTCRRSSTNLRFCSVECWEAHVPVMRHREAWAEEARSPTAEEWARENPEPAREEERPPSGSEPGDAGDEITLSGEDVPREILVVVSKVKAYVRARSGMNTSDGVMPLLSDHLRAVCDAAIRNAARAGRKTVMDRDFHFPA